MNIGNRYPKHSKTSNETPLQSKSKYLKMFYTLFALANPRFFTSSSQSEGEKRRRPKNQLFNNSSNIFENFMALSDQCVASSLGQPGWVGVVAKCRRKKRICRDFSRLALNLGEEKCRRAKNLLSNTTSKRDRKTQYLNSLLVLIKMRPPKGRPCALVIPSICPVGPLELCLCTVRSCFF